MFNNNSTAMPWFGMDIGGSLAKLVFFEPTDIEYDEAVPESDVLVKIKRFLKSNTEYGPTGAVMDMHLQIKDVKILGHPGSLHFIRFPISSMSLVLDMVKEQKLSSLIDAVHVTGGGAYRFENDFKQIAQLQLEKHDEHRCTIRGIHYIDRILPNECYFYKNPMEDCAEEVNFDLHDPYPYLLVNIGTAVTILAVHSQKNFQIVGGTNFGGGTFLGLCCLLTGCDTFEEAIELAAKGDSTTIDKLVRDIYGGGYDGFDGVPGSKLASSFALMTSKERRDNASKADLAKATLVSITTNIGYIAISKAHSQNIERVVFIGNFLRGNTIAMKLLGHSMQNSYQGKLQALFLQHELEEKACSRWGININPKKCKIMTEDPRNITLDQMPIDKVENFVFLGSDKMASRDEQGLQLQHLVDLKSYFASMGAFLELIGYEDDLINGET